MTTSRKLRTRLPGGTTDAGRNPTIPLLGVVIACTALVAGFNVASASVSTAGVEKSPVALEPQAPTQAASVPLLSTPDTAAPAGALESPLGSEVVPAQDEVTGSATGQVVVFETETNAMTAFADPAACNNAPELAHTIMNFTDQDITLFADDRCGVELIDVRPGFGSHVAPGQSFAAID